MWTRSRNPINTRRRFDADTTLLIERQKSCYNVETTSCACWEGPGLLAQFLRCIFQDHDPTKALGNNAGFQDQKIKRKANKSSFEILIFFSYFE